VRGMTGGEEWLVNAVMTMYRGAQTVVRTTGESKVSDVKSERERQMNLQCVEERSSR